MAGSADMELDNRSGDYWIENAASPLFGKILPGRQVRIRMGMMEREFGEGEFGEGEFGDWESEEGNGIYNVFKGFLDEPPQDSSIEAQSTGLPCLGTLSWLRGKKISTPLYENIRVDQALAVILDLVGAPVDTTIGLWDVGLWDVALWGSGGWPSEARVLNVAATTLLYWWLDDVDAFDAAVQLLNTEGPWAAIYEDDEGRIVFEGRHYRLLTERCTTPQATFRAGVAGDTEPLYRSLKYMPRLRDVINVCEITVNQREEQALGVVWSLGATITLGSNESRSYRAKASDPFKDAVTPVPGVDYMVTSGSLSTVSLDRNSGQSCTITLIAGAGGAVVTGLQLRAKPLTITGTYVVTNSIDTTASQAKYGQRKYPHDIWPEISYLTAQDLANGIVGIYQEPKAAVNLLLQSATYERLVQQLERQISDRVRIIDPMMAMDAEFFIEAVAHNAKGVGLLETNFTCEKAVDFSIGVWDVGLWDVAVWGF